MIPYQGVFWEFSSELIIYNPISVRERYGRTKPFAKGGRKAPAPCQCVGFLVICELPQLAFDTLTAQVLLGHLDLIVRAHLDI